MAPRAAARLEAFGFHDVHEYKAGKLDWMAAGLPTEGDNTKRPRAGDSSRKDVPLCRLDERVGDVKARADQGTWDVAVAVDDQRRVLGLLRAKELANDPGLTIDKAMRPGPSTFRPYVPIKEMADYMVEHKLETSPVTTSDGKLVGVLYREDAVKLAAGCPDCARKML